MGQNDPVVSDLSGSDEPVLHAPESGFVVDAVDALLRRDTTGARLALLDAAAAVGWPAVAHRLDVAGRALAIDAGLSAGTDDVIVLLPDDASQWPAGDPADAAVVLSRWSSGSTAGTALPLDQLWSALGAVTWLVERAGYPAEVVV